MRLLKICLGVLLVQLMFANTAYAEVEPFETNLPIICGDTSNIIEGLREEYDEEIVMMSAGINATGDELFHSLWINYGDQTWSFIVVNKQKDVTCVIASGDTLTMFFPKEGGV